MTDGASFRAEQAVEDSVDVGNNVKGNFKVKPICGEAFGGRECDHGYPCVTELVEVIAHGDHVFLARQSSEVTVEDEH
ncbi:MAG: hypothetical protein ABIR12_01520 [Ilumatobacteraceae bacterium]